LIATYRLNGERVTSVTRFENRVKSCVAGLNERNVGRLGVKTYLLRPQYIGSAYATALEFVNARL
jgi:hypothetical protein